MSTKPFFRAIKAITKVVVLPKIALTNPHKVGPVTTATLSTDVLNQIDRGMIDKAAVIKIA